MWPASSLRVGLPVFMLEPCVEAMGQLVGGLEPEEAALEPDVAVLEPEVVALEPKVAVLEPEVVALEPEVVALEHEVAALETEAMQPCLALCRHHPQHYDMLVTTCETKEVYE